MWTGLMQLMISLLNMKMNLWVPGKADKLNECELCSVISYSSSKFGVIFLPRHKITLHISQPKFTFFSFQENTYIHISQLFVSLSVGILHMPGLNDHKS
jgi:hypothetical protein